MSMMLRRGMMVPKVEPGGLPDDYLQVEYLEGTGTQYIDVDSTPNDYEFDITFMITATRSNKAMVTGYQNWVDNNAWCVMWNNTDLCVNRKKGSTSSAYDAVTTVSSVLNKKLTASAYKLYAEIYNEESGTTIVKNTEDCSSSARFCQSPVVLFRGDANQGYNTRYVSARVYSAKYYLNGTLAYDLVPCIRIADSKPGMYDLVGRQFYTNAGTGEFLTGYVADGLVFHLDGIDRGGVTGQWKDIVGGKIATLTGTYTENTNYIDFPGTSPEGYGTFDSKIFVPYDEGTIETAVELTAYEGTGRPIVSFDDDRIGGSISSQVSTGYGGALRWYLHNGYMKCWRFPETSKSLVMTASGNIDRAICNGYSGEKIDTSSWSSSSLSGMVAFRGSGNKFKGKMYAVRIYDRKLSAAEMLINQRVDNTRFNLGLTI